MRKLKLLSLLMLIAFSVGNMWAAEELYKTATFAAANCTKNSTYTGSVTCTIGTDSWTAAYAANNNGGWNYIKMGGKRPSGGGTTVHTGTIITSASYSDAVTKVVVNGSLDRGSVSAKLIYASNSDFTEGMVESDALEAFTDGKMTFSIASPVANRYYKLEFVCTNGTTTNGVITINSVEYYIESAAPTKTLTGVTVSGAPTKTSYYAGDEFDPSGLTVKGSYDDSSEEDITSGITWSYDPSQELALNQTSIRVKATVSGITSVDWYTVSSLSVTEAPAAIEYAKFTGNIEEGDYVIYYSGKAMKNTVASNRLSYDEVTPVNDKIKNPSEAIVWHIAPSATEGYWTVYNADVEKYLVCTGSNNQANLNASTDNALVSVVEVSEGNYNILSKVRQDAGSNNYYLRENTTYGYAFYGSGTGGIPTLYKKIDGTEKPAAGLEYAAADQKKLTKLGETFTAPTLVNPNNVTVTYASNAESVAEVNPSTGAVTIKAAGVAVITASFAGNDDFKAGSASYTVGVTAHAGTEADPYVAADAKIAIDVKGTIENAYATGVVSNVVTTTLPQDGYITFYFSADGATTGQQIEAYKCYGLNSAPFEAVSDVETGATVVITGTLKKYNSTYEFDQNCHLVSYEAPAVPKTHIANTKETAYTVAQAITYAADGVHYDLDDYVYVSGVVYDVKSFNTTNGTLDIYIKDANAENQFELYKCAGINDGSATTPFEALTDVQVGNIVIGYGQLTVYNSMSELKQGNYIVDFQKPVTGIQLDATAEVEEGSTVNLTATILPSNATGTIVWTVESGSDKASVDAGVVTGVAEGTAVIRATVQGTEIHAECTVTVTAAAPADTRKVAESPTEGFSSISGDLSGNEISFAAYQGGSATAPSANNTAHELRLYKYQATTEYGGYVTINAKTGCTIDQVVITVGGNGNVGWCKDAETLPTKESTPIAVSTSNPFDSGTGLNASSVTVVNLDGSNQFKIKSITVYYTGEAATLQSIAISGTASVLEYNDGDDFNPAGLVVTGHYSDNSDAEITDGITWAFDPSPLTEGTTSVSVTATVSEISSSAFVVNGLTVSGAAPALTDYYEKVTETAGIVEGTYLIVYEGENVAFNGGLETLDAVSNTIEVAITSDHKIGVTSATGAATVYIDPTAGTIQAANGKYIGVTSNSNGLKQSDNASAYNNSFAIDGDGNAVIGAVFSESTMTLRYNTDAGQKRFRYFKTTGSPLGQLYKLANEVIKPAAGLAWDPSDNIEITVGDAFTAPTLLNPNSIDAAEITIESSNTSLATVTAGVVELVDAATGTATITATFAGNADYKPATVSYTIKVNPASSIYVSPSLNVNFGSVEKDAALPDDKTITVTLNNVAAATATLGGTNPEAFSIDPATLTASGDITISVVSTATAGSYSATLTISDDASVAAPKVVNLSLTVTDPATKEAAISTTSKWVAATTIEDGMQVLITGVKDEVTYAMGEQKSTNRAAYVATVDGEGVLTPGEGTMAFTLVAQGDGTYAIRTSNGKYLFAANSGANHLKTQDDVDENAKWTVTVASAVAEGSSNRNVMQFNGGSTKLFSCYATASQSAIQLYVPKPVTPPTPVYTDVRTGLTAGKYYTICHNKQMTAIKGATLWEFESKDASFAYIVKANAPYVAGRPYIIYAESEKLEAVEEGSEVSAPNNTETNGLYGTFEQLEQSNFDAIATAKSADVYFIYNTDGENSELRKVNGQTGNWIRANRAYVIVAEIPDGTPAPMPGRQIRSMSLPKNTPTGMDQITNDQLQMSNKVIINGHLYIIRGEKMYDATGRLVK